MADQSIYRSVSVKEKVKSGTGRMTVRLMTGIAMLSAVSFLLSFLEFPVPLSPSFARMDLSDLPALVGAFIYGPLAGLLIELVKNLLGLFSTSTAGVGELANFLMGGSFVAVAGLIYRKHRTKKGALAACLIASLVMGIVAVLANYFILLPLFEKFLPLDQLIASFAELMPFIRTKLDIVVLNAFPFNLLKGLVISAFAMLIYKSVSAISIRER